MLIAIPYDQIGGSLNDVNILDIGIRTGASPLVGFPGALWFGTNTSIMKDLQIPVIRTGADIDIVTERRDGDVVYADVMHGLAPINNFNLYNVDYDQFGQAQLHYLLEGTVRCVSAPTGPGSPAGSTSVGHRGRAARPSPRSTTPQSRSALHRLGTLGSQDGASDPDGQ